MKKIYFIYLAVIILIIFSLETLSRIHQCQIPSPSLYCSDLPGFSSSEILSQKSLLAKLKETRNADEKISKEEYRQTADSLILEVNPEVLKGYNNGKSCSGFGIGYVRNDLQAEAKKFVKRHELEHLLQTGTEKNREFSANLAAGKEYPFGLLQTTFFSLHNRAKYQESPLCYILIIWKTFKTYFLP